MKSHFFKQSIFIISLWIICALTIFTFSSCNKDDNDNDEPALDNYYVNYVITGNGSYGRFSNWTATTPQGIYTNSGTQVRSWNQTYGPVDNGFKCEVQIGNFIGGDPTIQIYVSKNDEPFALKEIKTGNYASYTIDF